MHQEAPPKKQKKCKKGVLTIGYRKIAKSTPKKTRTGYDDTKQEGRTTRSDLTPNQMKR